MPLPRALQIWKGDQPAPEHAESPEPASKYEVQNPIYEHDVRNGLDGLPVDQKVSLSKDEQQDCAAE